MQLQEPLLLPGEGAENMRSLDPPTVQGFSSCLVSPDQLTAGIKADPVAVKQLVEMG
jgi:hypothetical protein